MPERIEYRFFWPHAQDDMNGARPRSARPTEVEIAEWREDLPTCWLERRVITEGPWVQVVGPIAFPRERNS